MYCSLSRNNIYGNIYLYSVFSILLVVFSVVYMFYNIANPTYIPVYNITTIDETNHNCTVTKYGYSYTNSKGKLITIDPFESNIRHYHSKNAGRDIRELVKNHRLIHIRFTPMILFMLSCILLSIALYWATCRSSSTSCIYDDEDLYIFLGYPIAVINRYYLWKIRQHRFNDTLFDYLKRYQ